MNLEELLIDRVMRANPVELDVVSGSLPLTHFGRIDSARTVTVGINPSVREFCLSKTPRQLLPTNAKRVIDREVLALTDDAVPSRDDALRAVDSFNRYFEGPNFLPWFTQLQKWALDPLQRSYLGGTVVHLDLVQWATDPVWGDLSPEVKEELVRADSRFLSEQIRLIGPELVLFNGATVVTEMSKYGQFEIEESGLIPGGDPFRYFVGRCGSSRAIGWSLNIQRQPDKGNAAKSALKELLSSTAR
jgi:hypothetical protein